MRFEGLLYSFFLSNLLTSSHSASGTHPLCCAQHLVRAYRDKMPRSRKAAPRLREEVRQMEMNAPRAELDKEELWFLGSLGWLTALAFAIVTFIPEII